MASIDPSPGVCLRGALLQVAGEDPDARRVKFGREIDPPLHMVDLFVELRSRRIRKRVAHGRTGDRQALQKRVPAKRATVLGCRRVWEVVRGGFDRVEIPRRRKIDEVVERHGLLRSGQRRAEGIGCEAQLHPRRAASLDRIDSQPSLTPAKVCVSYGRQAVRRQNGERGKAAEKLTSVHAGELTAAGACRTQL